MAHRMNEADLLEAMYMGDFAMVSSEEVVDVFRKAEDGDDDDDDGPDKEGVLNDAERYDLKFNVTINTTLGGTDSPTRAAKLVVACEAPGSYPEAGGHPKATVTSKELSPPVLTTLNAKLADAISSMDSFAFCLCQGMEWLQEYIKDELPAAIKAAQEPGWYCSSCEHFNVIIHHAVCAECHMLDMSRISIVAAMAEERKKIEEAQKLVEARQATERLVELYRRALLLVLRVDDSTRTPTRAAQPSKPVSSSASDEHTTDDIGLELSSIIVAVAPQTPPSAAATLDSLPPFLRAFVLSNPEVPACAVCFADFDDDTVRVKMASCGCSNCCVDCVARYITQRVIDKDVLPHIPCPSESCKAPLQAQDLLQSRTPDKFLAKLAVVQMQKQLARESDWLPCKVSTCGFGLLLKSIDTNKTTPSTKKQKLQSGSGPKRKKSSKKRTKTKGKRVKGRVKRRGDGTGKGPLRCCGVCGLQQRWKRREQELDSEFRKMIEAGTLRPCPVCNHLTMKEYGVCNVIECAMCSIWWNWATRETGQSSHLLKGRARRRGTLWQPGELGYQRKLERDEPEAFKALLERNGIKYDPNYTRGTGM